MADLLVLLPSEAATALPLLDNPAPGPFNAAMVDAATAAVSAAVSAAASPASTSGRAALRGSTQMLPNNNFRTWQHVREPLFGKNLSIVVIEEKKYEEEKSMHRENRENRREPAWSAPAPQEKH